MTQYYNITLKELKQHLYIDEGFKGDDALVLSYLEASLDSIRMRLNIESLEDICDEEYNLPKSIIQATKIMVATLYANREAISPTTMVKVPYTIDYLIEPYQKYN